MEAGREGVLVFCSKDQAYQYDSFDRKYAIVRSIRKGLAPEFHQRVDLAPSSALFQKTYAKWKRAIFTPEEYVKMQHGKTHTWFDLYEEQFLKEMQSMPLDELEQEVRNGNKVVCYCFCEDPNRCHRKILYEYFVEKLGKERVILQ